MRKVLIPLLTLGFFATSVYCGNYSPDQLDQIQDQFDSQLSALVGSINTTLNAIHYNPVPSQYQTTMNGYKNKLITLKNNLDYLDSDVEDFFMGATSSKSAVNSKMKGFRATLSSYTSQVYTTQTQVQNLLSHR